jgi:hypothetical protein
MLREHSLEKDGLSILSSVFKEHCLSEQNPFSINWMVFGLVDIHLLPSWHVQFYSAYTHLLNGLYKPALLDYAIAFEIFLATYLRERLQKVCGNAAAEYVLKKTWKIEERAKGLLKLACGQPLSERDDVYQPWDEHVRGPRNEISHGEPVTIDEASAKKAHDATWQAIRWIKALP